MHRGRNALLRTVDSDRSRLGVAGSAAANTNSQRGMENEIAENPHSYSKHNIKMLRHSDLVTMSLSGPWPWRLGLGLLLADEQACVAQAPDIRAYKHCADGRERPTVEQRLQSPLGVDAIFAVGTTMKRVVPKI
jgi:hypothetical protein